MCRHRVRACVGMWEGLRAACGSWVCEGLHLPLPRLGSACHPIARLERREHLRVVAEVDGGGVRLRSLDAARGAAELATADEHAVELDLVVPEGREGGDRG